MTNNVYGNNMLLFKSALGEHDTFRMIPVNKECPYLEVVYDPATTRLIVITKNNKQSFQFIPKVTGDGDLSMIKGKPRPNGTQYREERVLVDIQDEFFIMDKEEQQVFVESFAVNADIFDFYKYLRDLDTEPALVVPEKQGIVNKDGQTISSKDPVGAVEDKPEEDHTDQLNDKPANEPVTGEVGEPDIDPTEDSQEDN